MATIKAPQVGDQFPIGGMTSAIYVVEVEDNAYEDAQGRTRVFGHDDDGNEVEVFFFPRKPEDGYYEDEEDEA